MSQSEFVGAPYEETEQFWIDHAISPEVRTARRYDRWAPTPNGLALIEEVYAGLDKKHQIGEALAIAKQSRGWIIRRHRPARIDVPPIYPELRPHVPVVTKPPTKHWHGDGEPPAGLHKNSILRGKPKQAHLWKKMSKDDREAGRSAPPRDVVEHEFKNQSTGLMIGRHSGTNTEAAHYHQEDAKYTFIPNGYHDVDWAHTHERRLVEQFDDGLTRYRRWEGYKDETRRNKHVEKWHAEPKKKEKLKRGPVGDTDERHTHLWHTKNREESIAMRIDVNPLAENLLQRSDVAFFVIEGCLKADAILTAGAAVFSVPSVTLWDADELETFAKEYLKGKTVVIVPDADWAKNPAVVTQALLCQSRLHQFGLGVTTYVAAPPVDPVTEKPLAGKGVDDFLSLPHLDKGEQVGGGTLADLEILEWEVPSDEVLSRFVLQRSQSSDVRPFRRDVAVLRELSKHAGDTGELWCSIPKLASILRTDRKRVARAVAALAALGALTADDYNKLQVGEGHGGYGIGWRDTPTLTLVEEMRSKQLPRRKLGAVPALLRARSA